MTNKSKKYLLLISFALASLLYFVFVEKPAIFYPKWKDYKVIGIDVSRYQSKINWQLVRDSKISFAFVKATEGNYLVDIYFDRNWTRLRDYGIKRGAYHYYKPNISWKTQAKLFIRTVDMKKGDLPVVLDVEEYNGNDLTKFQRNIKKWLEMIEEYYGVRPIVYTSRSFYDEYLSGEFRKYNLWIANYSNSKPKLNDDGHWEFWQYSDKGTITGINGNVDMNVFYGTEAQLWKICKK